MRSHLLSQFHRRTLGLTLVLFMIVLTVAGGALSFLYMTGINEQRTQLAESTNTLASLIEATARFNQKDTQHHAPLWEETVKELRDGFTSAISGSMEIVLGKQVEDKIVFIWRQRARNADKAAETPIGEKLAEPMRRALSGQSGTVIALDYRGKEVMAAYIPLPMLGLGLVVKKDLSEVQYPYIRAAVGVLILSFAATVLGAIAFTYLISPMVAAIADSEDKLNELFTSMTSAIVVYEAIEDGADFLIHDCNQATLTIEGLQRQELIGHRLTEVFPSVKAFGLFDVLQRVWKTGQSEDLDSCLYRDGRISGWRENHVFRLSSGQVVALYNNTTEQQETKVALAKSEERFALAMQGANDGLWDWDLETNAVYFSPRWKSMLGYDDDELDNEFTEWESRVHPDDIGSAQAKLEGYIEGRIPTLHQEFRMRHKDGSWVHILARAEGVRNEEGRLIRLVGTHMDITPLRIAEQNLKHEKQRLEQYLDIAGNMFVILDPAGTILLANRTAHRILEWESGELLGKNWFEVALPDEWRNETRTIHLKVLVGDCQEIRNVEGEVLTRSGKRRTISWHNRILRNEAGEMVVSLSSGDDVTEHRRAEASLRELEFIVEHSPAIAFLWRAAEGWPVEYVSDNVRQFGYTPDDLTSGTIAFSDMVYEEDMQRVGEEVERYTAEGRDEFHQEYRILTRNGSILWIDDCTWIRRNDDGEVTHYQGMVLNITERKKAEQALKRANRALATISACNINLVRAQSEGELLDQITSTIVNKGGYPLAWVGFKGGEPEKWVEPVSVAGQAKAFLEEVKVSWSEDTPLGQGPTGVAIRSGELDVTRHTATDPQYAPWRDAAQLHGLQSSISLPLRDENGVIGILSISSKFEDAFDAPESTLLTELAADLSYGIAHLRAQEHHLKVWHELGVSSARLKTVTDSTVDAMVVVDSDGVIRFANPAAETLFGRPLGHDNNVIFGFPAVGRKWQRIDVIRPDGTQAVAELRAASIPWEDGESQLLMLHNITNRLEMEKTITNLERMEALGSLIGGIVHDIKNMLLPIISLTEMNVKSLPENSREQIRAKKVVEAANRVKDLSIGLLTFSRRSENEIVKEVVSIDAVARAILELVRFTLSTNISVVTHFDTDAGRVLVGTARMADAILNLIVNAADAFDGSAGEIRVSTERVEIIEETIPNIAPVPPGTYVCLTVSDNGRGMPQEVLEKAFEPFFTTKPEGHGTGLGLPMVLDFVKQHDGGLSVTSQKGEGTRFQLFFPLVEQETDVRGSATS